MKRNNRHNLILATMILVFGFCAIIIFDSAQVCRAALEQPDLCLDTKRVTKVMLQDAMTTTGTLVQTSKATIKQVEMLTENNQVKTTRGIKQVKVKSSEAVGGMSLLLSKHYAQPKKEINGVDLLSFNKPRVELSKEEMNVLYRIVEAECTASTVQDKKYVANVIINRLIDKEFPDTIKEIVFQQNGGVYQFSPILDGRYWDVTITDETIEAVELALSDDDNTGGALYFANCGKVRNKETLGWFSTLKFLFRASDGHSFFKPWR